MRVLSVSSGRADVSILTPVWKALLTRDVTLDILLTGMHCADDGASAREAIPEGATVTMAGADLGGGAGVATVSAMAAIQTAVATQITACRLDILLLIGDRLDMVPAATAAVAFPLPVAHLHGGELSLGAVDDRLRHAMTKLAHLHCVAHVPAAQRLAAMGEEPWRITVTGAPGLDSLAETHADDPSDLARALDVDDLAAVRLVTVHPETNAVDPLAPVDAVLAALSARPGPTVITAPNSDPGGTEARRRINAFVATHPWTRFVDTLGIGRYATLLRHARLMLGNSSSGIMEAEFVGLPVIDVGERQAGRERGPSVTHVPSDPAAVVAALDAALGRFDPAGGLYGDGQAASRVAAALVSARPDTPEGRQRLLAKTFFVGHCNFTAPWIS